jgi:NADH-quinone oxidoreductase subunit L
MFVGWEGVGFCSWALIGFWWHEPVNTTAGNKAFIVNRIGDWGFVLGIFALFWALDAGGQGTVVYREIQARAASLDGRVLWGLPVATVVTLLLFVGATGKSAQIPLHVWLPDAMAGPTPISALIHAATMVTAGVYLVARMNGLYSHAPEAAQVVAVIGVLTALFAATIALVQTDIKKVLAYSTVSQLGLMFLAAGVGAYGVAIFHVYTHAFFKACLFLGAGSVIHAMSGEQDITKMGGLARKIPVTFVTFAIATAAIAGIPPLAGFWSKDEILWFSLASAAGGSRLLYVTAAVTSALTAFYMFRLMWLTFMGKSRIAPEVEHHVHESPLSMTSVLMVLAVLSAVGGFVSIPHFLEPVAPLAKVRPDLEHFEHTVVIASIVIAVLGLLGAAFFYAHGGARARVVQEKVTGVHRLLYGKYFIDELYALLLARPLYWLSDAVCLRVGDRLLIDGTLNGLARIAQKSAGALGRVQTGNLHLYAFLVLLGSIVCLVWSWHHG